MKGKNNNFFAGGNYEANRYRFIARYLDRQLRRLISSSARMDGLLNIRQDAFYKCKVVFPCLEEQSQIGEYLEALDEKIALCENNLSKTRQFKKGLLQQMFV